MNMVEQFSTKMLILRHTKTASAGFVFEFTFDDESCTLDDVVPDSLRPKFTLGSDGPRYTMQSKEGDILLLKLMKGLKHNGWSVHASNSLSHAGTSADVESVFYYEKAITAVRSSSSVQATRSPVSATSSGKSGVEESKSAGAYTSKPLPNVPVKVSSIVDETDDPSQRRGSVTLSTNRDKLLQKYNQHRRASATRGLQGEDGAEPTRLSVSQLSKTFVGNAPQPPVVSATATVSASKVAVSAPAPPTTGPTPAAKPTMYPPQPTVAPPTEAPAVPQKTADAPKLGAASAYPTLVKRISSKGFQAVSAAQSNTEISVSKAIAIENHSAHREEIAQTTGSEPATPAVSKPVPPAAPVQPPARPPSVAPPAAAPPLPAPVAMPAPAPVSAPAPVTSPVAPPILPVDRPPVAPPVPATAISADAPSDPARSAAPTPTPAPVPVPVPVQSEPAEEAHEEIVRGSANPLSAPFTAQKRAAGTADNDPHEANRTNHYSKLGSAFLTGNGLLGGRGRGGAGRGFGSQQNLFAPMK